MKAILTSDTHFGFSNSTQSTHRKFWTKIAKENPDVLFHAGDWICNKQDQLNSTLRQLREYLPTTKVYAVRGNHDFWQNMQDPYCRPVSVQEMLRRQDLVFAKHNVTLLDGTVERLSDNIVVRGYDGWYTSLGSANRSTNDKNNLPSYVESAPTEVWLHDRAWKQLNNILDNTESKDTIITVTHFPVAFNEPSWGTNPKWEEQLIETSDFLLTGHSHRAKDEVVNDCRLLNCGSDYNVPKYVVFEI